MANGFKVTTPKLAHDLSHSAGIDAANRQMRKAGRRAWNVDDYNLAAAEMMRWYRNFRILNAWQWLPDGWDWIEIEGDWRPERTEELRRMCS